MDYDIDKAYLMGFSFNGNGRYNKWSNLFDMKNENRLNISETLPIPEGKKIKLYNPDEKINEKSINNNILVSKGKNDNDAVQVVDFLLKQNPTMKIVVKLTKGGAITIEERHSNGDVFLNDSKVDINNEEFALLCNAVKYAIPAGKKITLSSRIQKTGQFDNYKKPDNITYMKGDVINIDSELMELYELNTKINNPETSVEEKEKYEIERIGKYASILKKVRGKNKILVVQTGITDSNYSDIINKTIEALNIHESTQLTNEQMQEALKNYVSTRIQKVIQDLRNMDQAYTPVGMADMRKGSDLSAKGKIIKGRTMMNPLTKFRMQEMNMVGKEVIGIAANGEKVYFNALWYWNEGLRSGDLEWVKNLRFKHVYTGIEGRSKGIIKASTKATIANVNLEGVNNDFVEQLAKAAEIDDNIRRRLGITDEDINDRSSDEYKNYVKILREELRGEGYADDTISLLLSAATDNAKELILYNINSGTNLAKCYIHLIIMGFNINDIIAFMTSPTVNLVSDLSTGNMYDDYLFEMNVDTVLNMFTGKFPLKKFLYGKSNISTYDEEAEYESTSKQDVYKLVEDKIGSIKSILEEASKNNPNIKINTKEKRPEYWVSMYLLYKSLYNPEAKSLNKVLRINNNNVKALSEYIDYIANKVNSIDKTNFSIDLDTLVNVNKQATETSKLASVLLKFNQGIPTSEEDIALKLIAIQKIVSNRLLELDVNKYTFTKDEYFEEFKQRLKKENPYLTDKDFKELYELNKKYDFVNFNSTKWVEDLEYRNATRRFYGIIKNTWNVFDMIERIPHYNEMLNIFRSALITNRELFAKSAIVDIISKDIFDNFSSVDDKTIKKLLGYADDLMISNFLQRENFIFPVKKGSVIIDEDWSDVTSTEDSSILLNSITKIASFKKLMEGDVYELLKNGTFKSDDGQSVDPDNNFIKYLMKDVDNDGKVILRLNMDMFNISGSINNEVRYLNALSDFIKLRNFTYGGRPLTDWFILYNLIVNKNKLGRDRLTSMFGHFITTVLDLSIIKDFIKYIGNFDLNFNRDWTANDLQEIGYNKKDALWRIAPFTYENQELTQKAKMIKQRSSTGEIVYKMKVRGGGYSGDQYSLPKGSGTKLESPEERLLKLRNKSLYDTLDMPFRGISDFGLGKLNSNLIEELKLGLRDYIYNGLIDYIIKNC